MNLKVQEKDFEAIYKETYSNTLKFIVINCYHIDDINDILQDTYVELLKILKKKKTLRVKNINSFICGISKNIIKRHYYNKNRLTVIQNDGNENIPDFFEIEDNFITKENMSRIWKYINKKDLSIAKIFYLYFVLDMKIKEIAEELEISESDVKNKLYRNLKEVKERFGKEDAGYEKQSF